MGALGGRAAQARADHSKNGDDCAALEANAITALIENSGSAAAGAAVQADSLKDTSWPYSYGKNEFAPSRATQITKCAYWDYQRDKVYFRTNKRIKAIARREERIEHSAVPANKVISASRPPVCPGCGATCFSINGRHDRTVHDLRHLRWLEAVGGQEHRGSLQVRPMRCHIRLSRSAFLRLRYGPQAVRVCHPQFDRPAYRAVPAHEDNPAVLRVAVEPDNHRGYEKAAPPSFIGAPSKRSAR